MAQGSSLPTDDATVTQTLIVEEEEQTAQSPSLHLKLRKPKSDRKVQWTTETVDNEHMNKKKSKCCCVYEKPKLFGESSSSEDDDETHSCHGHKKKCYRHHGDQGHSHDDQGVGTGPSEGASPAAGPGPSSS